MKVISSRDQYATPALGKETRIFSLDQLPVTVRSNGAKSWSILHGVLATGETIELHESMQPAGIAPSPLHAIQHSELILVWEGTLSFEHDGKSEKVGCGGVILIAFGTMHTLRNIGDGPAKYLVVSIGGDVGLSDETEKTNDTKKENVLSQSQAFSYDELPVKNLPNGGTMRRVVSCTFVTGEYVEVHESMLPPGQTPPLAHRQSNSEILFVRTGKLEFTKHTNSKRIAPGDVVFMVSNELHRLKNVGNTPANYFVISIGRPAASSHELR